ncbi:hypothetical protein [Proteiniborus sp. MB09-C3]|uniref:hypothetical protein n=1 Tax=Proteiniborus sp. MB09-C3 TaxID=3050072 RepID=UPI002552197D|nr:hypothetical protein [Proteiniborus sp. MB09-C3]WIV11652.1 hypothetical protein QO263_16345 [Proteiniborus sp. MB09-C3]
MGYKINEAVTWLGKIHWDFGQVFGKKLSKRIGTTYNSFLIRDEINLSKIRDLLQAIKWLVVSLFFT